MSPHLAVHGGRTRRRRNASPWTRPRSSFVGCPVLSEKRQELRSAFVGVKQPCTVECVDVRGAGDQVGEPVGPFDVEDRR
jgi:hypothetical protein